ncbi:hypothetical protein [Bartonella sp. AR 15-3]|uniref:hypothetical protein n=1 Tax=Bartonella sp. AR 15-3 TaxID=545617 RepID=UPI0001F4C0C8|nr:hypothetical protein [Bartonella sp. AR 15-3]OPB31159.1 hypothetical protein BAR153v2_000980 [Bartonella sp. AR 15-3]CBI78772.1 exported hypothetical protein [Bartonella sp. AR 15-3]
MKIKGKILLSLIITILMIRPSISESYMQEGYINEVTIHADISRCALELKHKSTPHVSFGFWDCSNITGKAILDLAKIAAMLNRPVVITLEDNTNVVKPLLSIVLK